MSRYPCVLGDDPATCGVACLATVAKRFGESPSLPQLREIAGQISSGTNLAGLAHAAQALGFLTYPISATAEALPNLPVPFIAHVLRHGNGHFVVVHEVARDRIVVADPAEGLHRLKPGEFQAAWTGHALLLAKKEAIPTKLESPGLIPRLLRLVLPHRRLLVESAVASSLMTLLAYGSALLFSNLVDRVFPSGDLWTLHLFGLLAIALPVLTGLFSVVNTLLVVTLGQRISVHLMFPTLHRLVRLPMAYFDARRVGDILHRFGTLLGLKTLLTQGPVVLALDGMAFLLSSLLLTLYHWKLALAVLCVLPITALVTFLARIPLRRSHGEALATGGRLDAHLVSTISNISTVKAYGAEDEILRRTEPQMGRAIRLGARLEILASLPRILNRVLYGASLGAIYWIGGSLVMADQLSLGELVFCVTLAGSVFPPFHALVDMVLQIQQAAATLDRATDIIDAEPEQGPREGAAARSREVAGELRFEDVAFRYGHEDDTLRNVTFGASPGEVVAVVGESGSGKSTLLRLVQRLYLARAGRVLVDGIDVRDWDLERLRSAMAVVDQDCEMFAGSILENLKIAGAEIPVERFLASLRLVGLGPFVEKLAGRLDTDVGEAGARLSGGERQRLALARALSRKPRLLLLDEATAHLDPAMEREVFLRIRAAMREGTILLATHRVALARIATRVLVMENGAVVEQGPPDVLLARRGAFAKLCGEADERRPA